MPKSNFDFYFYVEHLGGNVDHLDLIKDFEAANPLGGNVVVFLKTRAMYDEVNGAARTYLVRDKKTNELVGFYSLCAGKIVLREDAKQKFRIAAIPGVEITNFAVNNSYKRNHPFPKSIGTHIFVNFILPKAKQVQEEIGASILYLYALPFTPLMKFYSSLGFTLPSKREASFIYKHCKPSYDKRCQFMFMPL